jgi:hypothetical protein
MAVMGEGRRHREEGCSQGPRLRLESRRVRATEMLVSRRVGRRQSGRGGLAQRECDGLGSRRMGITHHSQRPIFRSLLGVGRTSGYLTGSRCRSPRKALERCNEAGHSSGGAERYACVAATQRFYFDHPRMPFDEAIGAPYVPIPRRSGSSGADPRHLFPRDLARSVSAIRSEALDALAVSIMLTAHGQIIAGAPDVLRARQRSYGIR